MTTATKKKTDKVLSAMSLGVDIEHDWSIDETADLSHLGKYTDEWEEGAIDRQKRGDVNHSGEHRYFVSMNHGVYVKKDWSHVRGKSRQKVIKKYGSLEKATRRYCLEDYKRYESYNNDEWHMRILCVTVSIGCVSAESHLGGIESDCGEKYEKQVIGEVAQEAMHELRTKIMKRLKVE